jgi:hypothetical protein
MRKVRVCTYALLACVCFFLNLNCERTLLPVDSNKKIDYEQADTKARVTLKVFDLHSNAPISGAQVNIIGVDSALTDSKGTVIFDSIKPGDYIITCSKAGFEEIYDQMSLTLDPNSNTVPIVNQSSDGYLMAKKGVVVRGNIYYEKDEKYLQAKGAIIECMLISPTGQMFQNPLRTTTSTNGTFIFTALPEHVDYQITVRPFSDGNFSYTFDTLIITGKSAGDTVRSEDIILKETPDGVFLVMSHNIRTFTVSDPIVLEFSEAVDTSKLSKDSSITVVKRPSQRILIQTQWQNGNKKLVIKPFDGTWSYRDTLSLSLKGFFSITGKQLGNSNKLPINFRPIKSGALGNVMNIIALDADRDTFVNHNTNSILLNWSSLANASNYQIYHKRPDDLSWIFLMSVNDTFTSFNVPNGSFNLGKEIKYIVIGENSTTTSPLNAANAITVNDKMPPRINSTTSNVFNFDNTFGSTSILIDLPLTTFPEPMDTTKKPVLDVIEGNNGESSLGDPAYKLPKTNSIWMWTAQNSGRWSVIVDMGKDGSYDTLKVNFAGLTDFAGNKVDTTNGAGIVTYITRP